MSVAYVLVSPPQVSPSTGERLGWTASHAPDCPYALGRERQMAGHWSMPYLRMPVQDVPAPVDRCEHCGGGPR